MTLGKIYIALGLASLAYGAQAQIACTEITSQAGIESFYSAPTYMGGGAAFFDFDNDGDYDIWMAGGLNRDALYENMGDGQFTEIGGEAGLDATDMFVSTGVVTGDLNNDGFRDVVLTPHIGGHPLLFLNNGDKTFTEISETAGLDQIVAQAHAAALGDINKDGLLDIYIGTYTENLNFIYDADGNVIGFDHDCFDNQLYINNGDLSFVEAAEAYGVKNNGCALATTFTDFDLDSDPDILIANDFGEWVTPNALYQNDYPTGTYSNVSEATGMDVGIYGMGIAIGDYDQDMDLDYYITNLGRNALLENDGTGSFADRTTETATEDTYMQDSLLAVGWGTAFVDMDNDTDLDLFVCNGYVPAAPFITNPEANKNRLFINEGNGAGNGFSYLETALDSGLDNEGRGRGFAYADYDNDGDLDILVVNVNQHTSGDPVENILLFRNESGNEQNWLQVDLEGTVSNRDAFGAYLRIVVGDRSWVHDYNGGFGSHNSQHGSTAHFGLGDAQTVDSLMISWPSGEETILTDLAANQRIKVTEEGSVNTHNLPEAGTMSLTTQPNPFADVLQIQIELEQSEKVDVEVFDVHGRKLAVLASQNFIAGAHSLTWEPSPDLGQSGVYLVRITSESQSITQSVIRNQ